MLRDGGDNLGHGSTTHHEVQMRMMQAMPASSNAISARVITGCDILE